MQCQVSPLADRTREHYNAGVQVYIVRVEDKLISREGRVLLAQTDLNSLGLDAASAVDLGLCSSGARMGLLSAPAEQQVPEGYDCHTLRELMRSVPEADFRCAARGVHLAHWDRTHRYCGCCGTETVRVGEEVARRCPTCGSVVYPRISPAVIVAVVRDGRLLLAHNSRRASRYYSVIAGFVEPGETLEECVAREVAEETGITVGNIRYMRSQPWPFPDSLMIAFVCDYQAGEIQVDGVEIDHAFWCRPDELPDIPPRSSVARYLIDWFVESHS